MSLAEKLVTLRKQKGLTQMDLAERLNVSRQTISKWEAGVAVPRTDNLRALGELYGVSVDYLLDDDAAEATNCTRGTEGAPIDKSIAKKKVKRKMLLLCAVVVIAVVIVVLIVAVAILIGALVLRN